MPPAARMRYLQQVISLTGFNSVPFSQLIENIHFAQMKFARQFKDGLLEDWKSSVLYEQYLSIDSANRYFTPAADVPPTADHLTFGLDVDPESVLNNVLKDRQLVHLKDNEVLYFELFQKDGRRR